MIKLSDKSFIVSDLHIFHVRICEYCNRPYNIEGLKNSDFMNEEILRMNEDIMKEFDKLPAECTIWNNGDLFFIGSNIKKLIAHYDELKALVSRMKGPEGKRKLYLILGNHDNLRRKNINETRIQFYYSLGFDKVYDTPVIIEDNFILSHEPVYISPANNFKNLYGHTHDFDIKEDYFCYDWDNYAMITRLAKEKGVEPPEIEIKWTDRKVNLNKYFNVCWDKHHKILDLNKIIKNMKAD